MEEAALPHQQDQNLDQIAEKDFIPSPYTFVKINDQPELEDAFRQNPAMASYYVFKNREDLEEFEKNHPGIYRNRMILEELYKDTGTIETMKQRTETKQWFTQEYWRRKGLPSEEFILELQIGENVNPITLYNYNKDQLLPEEHLRVLQATIQRLAASFPRALKGIKYIVFDDVPGKSIVDDEQNFPINAGVLEKQEGIKIYPRAFDLSTKHRVQMENQKKYPEIFEEQTITNLEGTLEHELIHFGDSDLHREFKTAGYQYNITMPWKTFHQRHSDIENYELINEDDNGVKIWKNKKTGEVEKDYSDQWQYDEKRKVWQHKTTGYITPGRGSFIQFSEKPIECVSSYAAINGSAVGDDIADSLVAYLHVPGLLKKISPQKYSIFERLDASKQAKTDPPKVSLTKVPSDQIKLPEVPKEERQVYYYVVDN